MIIVNIAGYKFVELDNGEALRARLYERASQLNLKGTVLISTEGLNVNLAGSRENISAFRVDLLADGRFADIKFKESLSTTVPFHRLKVKIKPEIITMHRPEISPLGKRVQSISPEQLKQWIDEGRELVMLDTRNEFEVKAGSFNNALSLGMNTFSEFPQAAQNLGDPREHEKPIVTFCTGGIRCEKAALYLAQQGFREIYQLDGGILNYFERCGNTHYHGECFIFDRRITVNSELQDSGVRTNTPVIPRSLCAAED